MCGQLTGKKNVKKILIWNVKKSETNYQCQKIMAFKSFNSQFEQNKFFKYVFMLQIFKFYFSLKILFYYSNSELQIFIKWSESKFFVHWSKHFCCQNSANEITNNKISKHCSESIIFYWSWQDRNCREKSCRQRHCNRDRTHFTTTHHIFIRSLTKGFITNYKSAIEECTVFSTIV